MRRTPYFAQYFGIVTLDGQLAPAGALIELFDPRGALVGCTLTTVAGIYPYVRAHGEDAGASVPGLRPSEAVTFKVNGYPATTSHTVIWQADSANHQVDLAGDHAARPGGHARFHRRQIRPRVERVGRLCPPARRSAL